jgi:hypothetical protein
MKLLTAPACFFAKTPDEYFFYTWSSLNSITCSGSLGMISARHLEHPFETRQMYIINLKIQTHEEKILMLELWTFPILLDFGSISFGFDSLFYDRSWDFGSLSLLLNL